MPKQTTKTKESENNSKKNNAKETKSLSSTLKKEILKELKKDLTKSISEEISHNLVQEIKDDLLTSFKNDFSKELPKKNEELSNENIDDLEVLNSKGSSLNKNKKIHEVVVNTNKNSDQDEQESLSAIEEYVNNQDQNEFDLAPGGGYKDYKDDDVVLEENLDDEDQFSLVENKPKVNLYRRIAFLFVFLTLSLVGAVVYFSVGKLNIILIPNEERLSGNAIVDIYSDETLDLASNNSSLYGIVEQIELEDSLIQESSNIKVIGDTIEGKVTIQNKYSKNQPLVANTRLLSPDNKLFRTKKTVNIPAGGSVEVDIYADKVSSDMAIDPTTFTIPGLWLGLQDKVYGESKAKFVYKQEIEKYVQKTDIENAVNSIKVKLTNKAKVDFGSSYKGYNKVIYSIDDSAMKIESSSKVGDKIDRFEVKLRTKVSIIAFSEDEINKIAQDELFSIVPENKELIEFDKANIVYSLDNYDIGQGIATVNVAFEGKISLKENANLIDPYQIVGLNKEQLGDYLESFQSIAGYDLKFSPSFLEKIPRLVDRINIEIKRESLE